MYTVPGNCMPLGWQTTEGGPGRTWQAWGGSFLLLPWRYALSSRWLWTFNHNTCENRLEEVQGSATSSLFTPPLFQNIWPCVQLLCAERYAPCQRDKAKPPASAAKWQGNDQTDLQCQATRHCHHQVQWATCAAWHWGSGPHSEGEKTPIMDMWNAPMVQSRQPLTYRLMESMSLGGLRWHGSSWQRGIAESGSSWLSTLMIDIPGDLGPVVSLTSSLWVISLTVLADSIYNNLIYFAEKMWVATHIFSAKNFSIFAYDLI